MIVYRVETEAGNGPYGWPNKANQRDPIAMKLPQHLFNRDGALECECEARPGPPSDFSSQDYKKIIFATNITGLQERYGFNSIEQFQG